MYDILSFYRHVPLEAKIHVNVRWRLFPFASLEPYAPANGTIVDLGCGHGLWPLLVAHYRPQATILGIDPDENKIKIASDVASSAGIENVHFEVGNLQDFALPACDLVSVIDVMYVIPFDIQAQVVLKISASLRSGGKLLLKEMSFTPAWKFRFNQFEEWLAGRALGRSYGAKIYYQDEASWERLIKEAGMSFQAVRLDSRYPHPHLLFIGVKI